MKSLFFLAAALPLFAGDFENFTDNSLNYTQRNEACVALRGNKTPEVRAAMRSALGNVSLQSCAAMNLRIVGFAEDLAGALEDRDPGTRAVAARELGVMAKPEYLPALRKVAEDHDLLVASNAIEGLVMYEDHSSAPQLREIAMKSGLMTSLAFNALVGWNDPQVANIARKLIMGTDPGDQLVGVRAIGMVGNATDLPRLRELAKDDEKISSGARGFGFMPAITISKAAKFAIQSIEQRAAR